MPASSSRRGGGNVGSLTVNKQFRVDVSATETHASLLAGVRLDPQSLLKLQDEALISVKNTAKPSDADVEAENVAHTTFGQLLKKPGDDSQVSAFTSHDLRRTFATRLLESGADINTVRQAMGHASIITTQRYDKRDEHGGKRRQGRSRFERNMRKAL